MREKAEKNRAGLLEMEEESMVGSSGRVLEKRIARE